jgi:hypothetical protein
VSFEIRRIRDQLLSLIWGQRIRFTVVKLLRYRFKKGKSQVSFRSAHAKETRDLAD